VLIVEGLPFLTVSVPTEPHDETAKQRTTTDATRRKVVERMGPPI